MKRVITAVTRGQKSQLVGMSYEDMLSFITDEVDSIDKKIESVQSELEKQADTAAPLVKTSLVDLVENLFKGTEYGTYNADNLETDYYGYNGAISRGRRYDRGYNVYYSAPKSYDNVLTSEIRYYVDNGSIKYGFSTDDYYINGKLRKCEVKWYGPDRITSRNKQDINEKEFMDVYNVFTKLNNNTDLITSTVQRNTTDVLELQKEVAKLSKQPKISTRSLFWSWFYLNKVVVSDEFFDDIYFVSKVKSSGIPILSYVTYNERSGNIGTYIPDSTFSDSEPPTYMFNCSLEDVLSGKVIRNNKTTGSQDTEMLNCDMLTCDYTKLECPNNIKKALNYY